MDPTHEIELTEPVSLCLSDGKTLNPRARGWSRQPLHRANMRGVWGRTKRWDYWAILSRDLVFGIVYADVDFIGLASVWWADLRSGRSGGSEVVSPFARAMNLPEVPGSHPLSYAGSKLSLRLVDSPSADAHSVDSPSVGPPSGNSPSGNPSGPKTVHITAEWTEPGRVPASLDLTVTHPIGHESLNVVIPWSTSRYNFTTKDQALPTVGTFTLGSESFDIGGEGDPAWGVLDVGRGRWPYSTRWNWGGGAGYATTGERIGIQFGAKWTEGTGFTENGVTVDGRLHNIGRELDWDYSWENPMAPWHVRDSQGAVDLRLVPRFDKHTSLSAVVLSTKVHQVFGTWSGNVRGEDGATYEIVDAPGFAEECRNRW